MTFPKFGFSFGKSAKKSNVRSSVGLDIGNQNVKWVEIRQAEKPELVTCRVVPIKKGKGREGTVVAVKEAVQGAGPSRRVHSAIGGHSVIARYVFFPKMSREELRSHIEVEADKYIPFNVKDVVLDCQILEEKKEEGKIYVLIVAAKKEVVSHHLSLLEEAGLEAGLLDVDTFAAVNAFEHFLGNQAPSRFHALLDVGAKTTNASVLRGTTILFSRDIPIGGSDFTKAISEKLNLEMDAAEVLKCSGAKSAEELLALIGSSMENLIGEIKLSFDYFENQYDKRVERIFISGGSSRLSGFAKQIQQNFNVETLSWDPLQGITVPSEALAKVKGVREELAVAVGLALRSAT